MDSARLLNEHEAAKRLGLSVATMRRRRLLKQPPAWVKIGGRVLYRPDVLDAFIEASTVAMPFDAQSDATGKPPGAR